MNEIKLIVVCCCLILLFGCANSEPNWASLPKAKVTRVVSGQTIEVTMSETSEVSQIRIAGIDAPDMRQLPWGKAAQTRLIELVMGKQVLIELETEKRDRFNRLNAHVWQDQTLISQQLVQEGCVLANTSYTRSYSKLLTNAQEYARLMGYGIWNRDLAMRYTPKQFRSTIK
ncbi:thermonuclease family protein [Pleurocapsales cyanobacterium LEGE 10410]|nr:thermonuclease family protein [Pleurocapsales cyanobacterium LEGE 10410]